MKKILIINILVMTTILFYITDCGLSRKGGTNTDEYHLAGSCIGERICIDYYSPSPNDDFDCSKYRELQDDNILKGPYKSSYEKCDFDEHYGGCSEYTENVGDDKYQDIWLLTNDVELASTFKTLCKNTKGAVYKAPQTL